MAQATETTPEDTLRRFETRIQNAIGSLESERASIFGQTETFRAKGPKRLGGPAFSWSGAARWTGFFHRSRHQTNPTPGREQRIFLDTLQQKAAHPQIEPSGTPLGGGPQHGFEAENRILQRGDGSTNIQ